MTSPTFTIVLDGNQLKVSSKTNFSQLSLEELTALLNSLDPDAILDLMTQVIVKRLPTDMQDKLIKQLGVVTAENVAAYKKATIERKLANAKTPISKKS